MSPFKPALESLKANGRYRTLNLPKGLDLTSNDYLSLRDHPQIREAAARAIEEGISLGAGGSRLLRGHHEQHQKLEEEAAAFFNSPRALLFANGFQANHAIFSTLPGRHDTILFDAFIHASARESIQTSHARHIRIPHNDVSAFEDALKNTNTKGQTYIAVESLYSMDGDRAPLAELAALTHQYGAILIIDEAHTTGIDGPQGKGASHAIIQEYGHANLITLHTCGKALGLSGGIVCAGSEVIEYMINKARPFIYSTAPAPFNAFLVREALKLCASDTGDAQRAKLAKLCQAAQEQFGGPDSHIVPIILGADEAANEAAAALQSAGYDIRAIRPPTVPEGSARLRLSLHADLDITILDEVKKSLPSSSLRGGGADAAIQNGA